MLHIFNSLYPVGRAATWPTIFGKVKKTLSCNSALQLIFCIMPHKKYDYAYVSNKKKTRYLHWPMFVDLVYWWQCWMRCPLDESSWLGGHLPALPPGLFSLLIVHPLFVITPIETISVRDFRHFQMIEQWMWESLHAIYPNTSCLNNAIIFLPVFKCMCHFVSALYTDNLHLMWNWVLWSSSSLSLLLSSLVRYSFCKDKHISKTDSVT